MSFRLTTERLILSPPATTDITGLVEYWKANREHLAPWTPKREEAFYTQHGQSEVMLEHMAAKNAGTRRAWLLRERGNHPDRERETIVGRIALSNIVRGAFHSAHLSYDLAELAIGRGYMAEALAAVIAWAFKEDNLHRLEANIMPSNVDSKNVIRPLGFVCEGVARQYLRIAGKWEDHEHWVLLNERWEAPELA